ncbi:MAG: hypothetical protein WCL13_01090 [bacterium]
MQFKAPKNTARFFWTGHALGKMQYYGLSAQRILRVINNPARIEEGIAENTTAVMQPSSVKKSAQGGSASGGKTWSSEIWVMYQLDTRQNDRSHSIGRETQRKIISAWRYPGISPKRGAVPQEIINEVKNLIK